MQIVMRDVRGILEERDVEPRRFLERVRADGLLKTAKKGFSFTTRVDGKLANCIWLSEK